MQIKTGDFTHICSMMCLSVYPVDSFEPTKRELLYPEENKKKKKKKKKKKHPIDKTINFHTFLLAKSN